MSAHAPSPADIGQCVACGLCLPHCPTFRVTGKESASPRGRIAAMRAVVDEGAPIDATFIRMMDECLACLACQAACPSGVPYGRLIESARAMVEPHRDTRARTARALGLGVVLRRRWMIRTMAASLGVAQLLRIDRLLPRRLTAGAPRVSLRELRRPLPGPVGDGPNAALLTGCVMNVANSAGCSAHMKTWGELLADDPAWADRAERVAGKVRDLLELDLQPHHHDLGRVSVHDACHHLHAQRIGLQLRGLLAAGGAECVEIADAGRCCGAAGLYSVTQPEMSATLRTAKARAIHEAGAPVVAVANPGCAGQIAQGLREIGSHVRVVHPAELVEP